MPVAKREGERVKANPLKWICICNCSCMCVCVWVSLLCLFLGIICARCSNQNSYGAIGGAWGYWEKERERRSKECSVECGLWVAMDFYVVINIGLCRMFLSGDVCGLQCRYGGQLLLLSLSLWLTPPHTPTLSSSFHVVPPCCMALTILAKILWNVLPTPLNWRHQFQLAVKEWEKESERDKMRVLYFSHMLFEIMTKL